MENLNTVRFKNGIEHPLGTSWDGITGKPFYEETVPHELLPVTETTFTLDYGVYEAIIPVESDICDLWSGDWKNCVVQWDGKSYDISEATLVEGLKAVGNVDLMLDTGDNGIPFILTVGPAGLFGESCCIYISPAYDTPPEGDASDTTSTVQHSVGITIYHSTVTKLPDQFQHQTDWDETDDRKASFVRNKPFGVIASAGDIVTDGNAQRNGETSLFFSDTDKDKLIEGVTYTVQVGDHSYKGIGLSVEEVAALGGFPSELEVYGGILIMDDANTGIGLMASLRYTDYPVDLSILGLNDGTTFESGTAYPVKIALSEDVIKPLDPKYIPAPPVFDLAGMGLPAVPLTGEAVRASCDTQKLREALDNGVVKVSLLADIGMEQPVPFSMIAGAANLMGSFQISFMGDFSSTPALINIEVGEECIYARIYMLQKQ